MNAPLHAFDSDVDPGRLEVEEEESRGADVLSQIGRLVGIVRRRWLIVLACVVLGAAGAAVAVKLLPPRWKADATVLLRMTGPQVLDKVQGVNEDEEDRRASYRDYYETQRQIMGSRAVAERALSELGLAHDPVFLGVANIESEQEREARLALIDPVERLRDLVNVGEVRNSRLVRIQVEYPEPEVAAEIVNAIADSYLTYVESGRSRQGEEAQADIAREKAQAAERLEQAELAFEAFKQKHQLSSVDQLEEYTAQGVLALNGHRKDAEAHRIRLESLLAEAKRLHGKGNLSGANLLSEGDRRLLESMREERLEAERDFSEVDVKYGPKHEEHRKAKRRVDIADQKIEREGSELVEALEAKLNAAKTAERKLASALSREKAAGLRVTDLEREYRKLEREAATAAEDYLLIARRDTEIAVTNRVEEQGIEILDRATVPTLPVFPNKPMLILVGLAAGLGLGVLLALSVDFRDERIRGATDLQRALSAFGLPVLGQLPQMPADTKLGVGNVRGQRRQRDLYAHLFPQSLMAERCRGIRTSLAFSAAGETLRSIMVTSPGSSEGKSSTAMNLALSFCQSGKRVVLIDADLRRPRIHQIFPEAELGDEGLSSLLQGHAELEDVLLTGAEDAPEQLSVLPCGPVPDNPAELLDTPAFRRLLVELQEHCDLVVVDTPPVLPVTDAMILARHVDGVVLVGRCGSTRRGDLQHAVAQLARGDTNVIGVVLNDVDSRSSRYGYAGEYYTYRSAEPRTGSA